MKCPKCNYVRTPEDANPEWQCPSCGVAYQKVIDRIRGIDRFKRYIPNQIPFSERASSFMVATLVLIYGTGGLLDNDIYIPGRRGSPGTHYHDEPAIFLYLSLVIAAAVSISVIVDHYDKRNNEPAYKLFRHAGLGLAIAFMLVAIYMSHESPYRTRFLAEQFDGKFLRTETQRQAYRAYSGGRWQHKAFAVTVNGGYGYSTSQETEVLARTEALAACRGSARWDVGCIVYDVNGVVVIGEDIRKSSLAPR